MDVVSTHGGLQSFSAILNVARPLQAYNAKLHFSNNPHGVPGLYDGHERLDWMNGMIRPEELYGTPNALAPHYSRFRVAERLLLTGHSHQAWPDVSLQGHMQAWLDAAEHLDVKWERSFAKAERVRQGYLHLLGEPDGHIALAAGTHDLVVRFLSALPLRERTRIVTTDGEFHTIRRQLDRIAEEGVEVIKVPARPASDVSARLIEALDEKTAAVMVSSVFYHTGHRVTGLGDLLEACRKVGAELLVDVYHSLNVVPFSLKQERLEFAFVVGGGYKYCQLGEGNGFLFFPRDCRMRPLITGWFSEFEALSGSAPGAPVAYGPAAARFAGSTYDPTSHYRAAEVFDFFKHQGLTPDVLREVSQHQVGLLASAFDALNIDPKLATRDRSVLLDGLGGFLVLYSPRAGELCRLLREQGVAADFRGEGLRLGPAPYLSDRQLLDSIEIFGRIARSLVF